MAPTLLLAACSSNVGSTSAHRTPATRATSPVVTTTPAPTTPAPTTTAPTTTTTLPAHLAAPGAPTPFATPAPSGDGTWSAAGRSVDGVPAVYETELVPPGGTQEAGIAWMDTDLCSGQLYRLQEPGRRSLPVHGAHRAGAGHHPGRRLQRRLPHEGRRGGYYTEGKTVVPLVAGAASLVIDADGTVTVGAWGSDVTMTPNVVAVRQNLVPLVEGGRPTAEATSPDWQAWATPAGPRRVPRACPGSSTSGAPAPG